MTRPPPSRPANGPRREPRLARPYTMVGGRTRVGASDLGLESLVVRTERGVSAMGHLRFERLDVLALTAAPISILELAAYMGVPYGVVRVLVGDLASERLVIVRSSEAGPPSVDLLERVLQGLHAL